MQDFIDFLARKEISIVVVILFFAIAIYLILWFYEWIKKHEAQKKIKNNTMELKDLANQIKIEEKKMKEQKKREFPLKINPIVKKEKKVSSPKITPSIEITEDKEKPKLEKQQEEAKVEMGELYHIPVEISDVKEEKVQYKEEVYTQEEAKEELNRLTEMLKKENQEEVLKQQNKRKEEEKIEVSEEKNIPLTAFEDDQEMHAIISLEELLEKGKTITQEEIMQYEDDGNEPISIAELEARYKEEKQEEKEVIQQDKKANEVELKDFYQTPSKPYHKENSYHPTPVISPIFGIEEDHIAKEKALELESTATLEKFDEEIRKTNQFLAKLKELQTVLQKESD